MQIDRAKSLNYVLALGNESRGVNVQIKPYVGNLTRGLKEGIPVD